MSKRLLATAAFTVAAMSCTRAPQPEHAGAPHRPARPSIDSTYRAFESAFERGDADAIARAYTDDAVWLVPDAPPIKGRSAIAAAWKQNVGAGGNRLAIEVLELQESGDWAYEVGRFTARTPTDTILFVGKYIVVWQRQANGDWKTHRDIFNWDVRPAGP